MASKKILIVYHSQSGNTEAAAQAVAEGVGTVEGADPIVKRASQAGAEDLTGCDALCEIPLPDLSCSNLNLLIEEFGDLCEKRIG